MIDSNRSKPAGKRRRDDLAGRFFQLIESAAKEVVGGFDPGNRFRRGGAGENLLHRATAPVLIVRAVEKELGAAAMGKKIPVAVIHRRPRG